MRSKPNDDGLGFTQWYFWWVFHICRHVDRKNSSNKRSTLIFNITLPWFDEFFQIMCKFQTIVKIHQNYLCEMAGCLTGQWALARKRLLNNWQSFLKEMKKRGWWAWHLFNFQFLFLACCCAMACCCHSGLPTGSCQSRLEPLLMHSWPARQKKPLLGTRIIITNIIE